ncbi:MAG TPA: SbcC/MukB-like Walker B domain-containing protein, partial [Acidimicrobiales bacterium]
YRRLDQLGARVNDAAARVGAEPTPEPPAGRAEPEGLAAGAAWGEALLDRTRAVVAAVEAAAGAHRSTAADHDATAARALEQVGAADADALHAAQATAIAMAATARDEHERALAEVPLADELDRRITAATRFLDAVGLVRDRLANSAFIGEVMKRRHAELLGVASRILGEVTGGRYGFSVDFAIVDLQSNQERPTKTLSGGESFLASLALALAMVEIAARGGGRLDALFLDEGFGSLDRASLDAAIDALEARAGQGRLVAVISHVAGLAERIEDVLGVRAGPGGSVATWQTAADKEATFVGAALTALDSLDSLDAG